MCVSVLSQAKSILGDHLTNVGLNRDNVSEVLQQYMEAHCAQTDLTDLSRSLRTKSFQAHTPAQKASVLAFLVNEVACSKSVIRLQNFHHFHNCYIYMSDLLLHHRSMSSSCDVCLCVCSEIDKSLEHMNVLRKDECIVEAKLKK